MRGQVKQAPMVPARRGRPVDGMRTDQTGVSKLRWRSIPDLPMFHFPRGLAGDEVIGTATRALLPVLCKAELPPGAQLHHHSHPSHPAESIAAHVE